MVPAFYAFYLDALGNLMPYHLGPVLLLFLAGVLVAIGAVCGPETRDVDLRGGTREDPATVAPETAGR